MNFKTRLLVLCAALALSGACRCQPPINQVDLSYRVVDSAVEFGRVLEGEVATRQVTLQNTGRGDLTIEASTAAPFGVVSTVELQAGAEAQVEVTFTAGSTESTGTLAFGGNQMNFAVALHGVGVRPKECLASGPCRESHYVLETDQCVETVLGDGALCTPTSQCLENGQCLSGQCQGTPRSCRDTDECTIDACSEAVGCVYSRRSCPAPTRPCRVASCDSATGCGEAMAPDGTVCGPVSCVSALLCVSGDCVTVVPPDGFPCAPPTPCQAEGQCHSQVCTRPDAGPLSRDWVLPLEGAPAAERPAMLVHNNNLYLQLCGVTPDGGADAGADAGFDGGPPLAANCALLSFTPGGFERFTVQYADRGPHQLAGVGAQGVAVLTSSGLDVHALSSGALRASVPLGGVCAARGVATDEAGVIWVVTSTDAGSVLSRVVDGGLEPLATASQPLQLLALDELGGGVLSSADAGDFARLDRAPDGGLVLSFGSVPSGGQRLALAEGAAVLGSTTLLLADGGQRALAPSDAGATLLERFALLDGVDAVQFEQRCEAPAMSCLPRDAALWVRVWSLATGALRWQARVAAASDAPHLEEASLATAAPGAVVTLVQRHSDGGNELWLEGWVEAERPMACPVPPGGELLAAVFASGTLYTLRERDGGSWLEAWPLTNLALQDQGWPQADGISGQRRAR